MSNEKSQDYVVVYLSNKIICSIRNKTVYSYLYDNIDFKTKIFKTRFVKNSRTDKSCMKIIAVNDNSNFEKRKETHNIHILFY